MNSVRRWFICGTAFVSISMSLMLLGCVGIGAVGEYTVDGESVAADGGTRAVVENSDFVLVIEIRNPSANYGVYGLVVPTFPIYPAPELQIEITLDPKERTRMFVPESLYIQNGQGKQIASEISIPRRCRDSVTSVIKQSDRGSPMTIGGSMCILYTFKSRQTSDFSVNILGFPEVFYKLKYRSGGGIEVPQI